MGEQVTAKANSLNQLVWEQLKRNSGFEAAIGRVLLRKGREARIKELEMFVKNVYNTQGNNALTNIMQFLYEHRQIDLEVLYTTLLTEIDDGTTT